MEEQRSIKSKILGFYEKKYKQLLIIPIVMLVLAIVVLGVTYARTGDFINKGITLKGGITVTIPTEARINTGNFEKELSARFPDSDISVRTLASAGKQTAISVSASDIAEDSLIAALEEKLGKTDYTVETTGPTLGAGFFRETFAALLMAFAFMGCVVFLYFRVPIPSIAVIFSAFSDIVVTIAIVDLLGVKVSTAGIASFLMLIGYSVDTDILLTARVLKSRVGTVFSRSLGAMKTGMTMTIATQVATIIAYLFAQSPVIKEIMLIIFIGLLVDIVNTWIMNTGILRWYLEGRRNV